MPAPFRYVTPVAPKEADGRVAAVYRQIAQDFGLARMPLFMTLSPAPDVLAAVWSLLRESLVAGSASRTDKEVVAVAVSSANRCPFCVSAHSVLLHATGAHGLAETVARGDTPADPRHARLFAWGADTRTTGMTAPPVPPDVAAEYIGTALTFHFINRMVSALLTDDVLPGGLQRWRPVRRLAGRMVAGATRRRHVSGTSLALLDGDPADETPAWAAGSPSGRAMGTAFAALHKAAARGGESLSSQARLAVRDEVDAWDGAHPALTGGWPTDRLSGLPAVDRPGVRLALLAAMAPYRVSDRDVAEWRSATGVHGDAALVRLLAFGAMTAVTHLLGSDHAEVRQKAM
ncbi:alkyl hydroperoxide reductase AhpD [Planotetraspora thailandica]|uniref:Alkyl hydroperoxide reductase AhpD n=1 Tax=Planotetraspora thailandica TaxID=487172 RepID=A0A8J3V2Y0_9ACTN|nr:carboxymuconolactone decarboxylase family protein [Planotetraspora thailandica]GII56473.1 alkyl hydroperoxide reductase AhpD [Planotetraspora thailandica]